MELQPIEGILEALATQGFTIEVGLLATEEGGIAIVRVSKDEAVIAHFVAESQNLNMRLHALDRLRKAGFFWPD